MNDIIEYVKANYNEISHYDLAMSLMYDQFTDDLEDLTAVVNGVLGEVNNEAIEEAYDDAQ